MRLYSVLFTQYCWCDYIKNYEMRWEYNTNGVGVRGDACTGFLWGNLRERDLLEVHGLDGRIMLRWMFRKWDVGHGLDGGGTGGGHY